ncbi:hypothetical protein TNCV_517221 [Trichonephila clavipes]|nr:hypothetical protein TNCV_517221 [Trichonephila clavipes]
MDLFILNTDQVMKTLLLLTSTPKAGRLSFERFCACKIPLQGGSVAELMIRQPRVRWVNANVAIFSCSRAFGDGPRHFEPWSIDEDIPSPNFHRNRKAFESRHI